MSGSFEETKILLVIHYQRDPDGNMIGIRIRNTNLDQLSKILFG